MMTVGQADPEGRGIIETLLVGAVSILPVDGASTLIESGVSVLVLALGIMRADTKAETMSSMLKIVWYFILFKLWVFGFVLKKACKTVVNNIQVRCESLVLG
jgi:hypothetical protein